MKRSLSSLLLVVVASACVHALHSAEKIDVTYVDGKHESGELLDQTVDKITLRVQMAGNQLDLPIPWTKIQSLSNGLTRDKVLKKWKDDNKDKLCPDCNGDRKIACKACGGTGLLARATQPCPGCKGEGTIPCVAKGCDKGEVPCPGKCLKLSEGPWVKGKEELLWHRMTIRGTVMDVSERHLGQIIDIGKNGEFLPSDCPLCNKTMKVACKVCDGTGATKCPQCKGEKTVPVPGPEKKCPDCNGLKTVNCPTCKGTGLKP